MLALGFAAVVAGLGIAVFMAASFSKPIRRAMTASEGIASGDLSTPIETKRRDELGRLLMSLDQTRASLKAIEENKERDRAEQLAQLRAEVRRSGSRRWRRRTMRPRSRRASRPTSTNWSQRWPRGSRGSQRATFRFA